MNMAEAISEMVKKIGINKAQLAKELGFSQASGVLTAISKARDYGYGMKVSTLIRWAHQCGYDLVLQPAGCLVEGQLVLGDEAKPRNLIKMEYDLRKAIEAQQDVDHDKGGDAK